MSLVRALQDVADSAIDERAAADPYFAGLNPHFQAAILLLERLGEAWARYIEFQDHPYRCCAPLAFWGLRFKDSTFLPKAPGKPAAGAPWASLGVLLSGCKTTRTGAAFQAFWALNPGRSQDTTRGCH